MLCHIDMKTETEQTREELIELQFLERIAQRRPNDPVILIALADLYTSVGQIEAGLETDLHLSKLCPRDPTVWYNLACSFSLMESNEKALDALDTAVDHGYSDFQWMLMDKHLAHLHKNQRFQRILYRIVTDRVSRH